MGFQRKAVDFSLNTKLIDYLREYGWSEGDSKKLREFAETVKVPVKTLLSILNNKLAIGPQLQARLFSATDDDQFAPRDDLERAALRDWKKNPTPPVTVITQGDRAIAESPHPENPTFFKDQLVGLLNKYNVGKKDGPKINDVCAFARMHPSALYGAQSKTMTVTVGFKAKLFLCFADPAFAPMNGNEKKQTEVWREQIPRPLPCVKSVSTEIPPKPTGEKKGEKIVPVRLTPLEQGLVNSPAFVKAVADKVAELLSDAAPKLKTATDPVASETATNDFISDAFIAETLAILTKASERLDSIMLLGNNPRRKIQTELDSKLPQLEDTLRRLFLSVRAISRTATAEAARKILEQETSFVKQFESAKGGK